MVPVPIHAVRRRERGYNQAEDIAAEVSSQTAVPVLANALGRVRPTLSQTRLGQEERQRNLGGAFACLLPEVLAGKRLLLVDDVFTTGATASECARLVLGAGGASVGVLALARVDADPDGDDFGREMEAVSGFVV